MKQMTFLSLFFFLVLSGCVGQEAFTKMARTGDTVALAVGGSPSHELDHVEKSAMTINVTDSTGMSYPATLRNLFRVYSDPLSRYNYDNRYETDQAPPWLSRFYRDPNQGQWIAIVDLTDPATGQPLPLQPGSASLQVNTPDLRNSMLAFGIQESDGSLGNINIEILPGTGSPHTFNTLMGTPVGDPSHLERLPHLEVSFDNSKISAPLNDVSTAEVIGGIEFTLDYDESIFGSPKFPPLVSGNPVDPRIKVQSAIINEAGNKVMRVTLLAPSKGVVASPDPENYLDSFYLAFSDIRDMKVFVAWDPNYLTGGVDTTNYQNVFQLRDFKVVDIDGNPITGVAGGYLVDPVISFYAE